MQPFGTGAKESIIDSRTVDHSSLVTAVAPLVKGGISYSVADIENQYTVGICTSISEVQLREKETGKKYSPDFHYFLQKKYFDDNWDEGSSPLNSLKVSKLYGYLPLASFVDATGTPYITEADRKLPYAEYIAKLEAIPEAEVLRLIGLCVDKLAGYASVDITDPQAIARAINSGKGILCRYDCGPTWWTNKAGVSSWNPADIDPLRKPTTDITGHGIIASLFDYSTENMLEHPNTWGIEWNVQGKGHTNWNNYPMTEAWVHLNFQPFVNMLKIGMSSPDVSRLQQFLNNTQGANLPVTGYFGNMTANAVSNFQDKYKQDILVPAGLTAPTGEVGAFTLKKLNSLLATQ